jgi:hypothetical protein
MKSCWPRLTDDQIRAVLAAGGYRSVATSVRGIRSFPAGCAVALQFGDKVTVGQSGRPTQTIQCSLRINGEDDRTDDVTRWRIERWCPRSAGSDAFNLAIEADLILGRNISLVDVAAHGGGAYRHLRVLIADARDSLSELAVDRQQADITGPAMRIEARQLRDLVAGRSGFVAPHRARVSSQYLRMTYAACDWLADEVLPDLARAVRALIVQANLPRPSDLQGETVSRQRFDDIHVVDNVSLMPAHEPVQ